MVIKINGRQIPHKVYNCKQCGKLGHWAKVCKSKSSNASNKGTIGIIFNTSTGLDALKVNVIINSMAITMEIDTGATYSILNGVDWNKIGSPKLQSRNITLKTYDESALRV